jgi:hypothetical protein
VIHLSHLNARLSLFVALFFLFLACSTRCKLDFS